MDTSTAAVLSVSQLAPIVAEAKALWEQILPAQDSRLTTLDNEQVVVGNLTPDKLAVTIGDTIIIDTFAAGYGWFIDPTPADDSEFTVRQGNELLATSRAAVNRMDLLTVVMHELGHVLDEHSKTLINGVGRWEKRRVDEVQ